MTEDLTGWHPDPTGRHEHRYFDGSSWTDHVSDAGNLSTDPVAGAEEVAKPAEPSRVDLPAITPEMLRGGAAAAPAPAAEPAPAAATPAAGEPAPAAVAARADDDAIDNQAMAEALTLPDTRPTSMAGLLSIVFPGTGHLWLGVRQGLGFGLIAATVAAAVVAYSVAPWFIGLAILVVAAGYALFDLRPELEPAMSAGGLDALSDVGSAWAWRLVGAGGILLVFALFLPFFRIKSEIAGIDAAANASGFDALEFIDLLSLAVGALSIVAAILALGVIRGRGLPDGLPAVLAIAGAVTWVLLFFRLLFPGAGDLPGVDIQRGPGILLALAAALTIAFGAASALAAGRRATAG